MEKRIGTKIVFLTPMTRCEYDIYRDFKCPDERNGQDDGYLVEYTDGGKPNDLRHKGYISWSPKEVADRAYQLCEGMTFEQVLEVVAKQIAIFIPLESNSENSFKERLINEYTELSERIDKLRMFICSEKFNTLPEIERNDLTEQLNIMEKYQAILLDRSSRLCNSA